MEVDGCSGVNCQNIPSNYDPGAIDLRKGIVARPGYKLVAIDYSGEELRIATNMSKEEVWTNEFLYGTGDLHTISARAIYNKAPGEPVTKLERGAGKSMNFLVLYGGGATRLAEAAKIPLEVARAGVENFFTELKGLSSWMKREVRECRKRGYTRTAFGRRRPLYEYYGSEDEKIQAKGDRIACNAAVQGTGGDIIKIALWRVWDFKRRNNLSDAFRILIPIHDEVVYEVREDLLHELIPKISELMKMDDILKDHLGWRVGLEVDAEYGDTFHVDRNYYKEVAADKMLEDAGQYQWPMPLIQESKFVDEKKGKTYVGEEAFEKQHEVDDQYYAELKAGVRPFQVAMGATPVSETTEPEEAQAVADENKIVDQEENPGQVAQDCATFPAGSERSVAPMGQLDEKGQYLDYTVLKTDDVAVKQTEMIWAVLKAAKSLSKGPCKKIRLKDHSGRAIYITEEALPVDGFIALAITYGV